MIPPASSLFAYKFNPDQIINMAIYRWVIPRGSGTHKLFEFVK